MEHLSAPVLYAVAFLAGVFLKHLHESRTQQAAATLSADAQAVNSYRTLTDTLTARVTLLESDLNLVRGREMDCREKQVVLEARHADLEARYALLAADSKTLRDELAALRTALPRPAG